MVKSKSDKVSVNTFLSFLENPVLRYVIRFVGNHRLKDGKSYLEVALDELTGNERLRGSIAGIFFSGVVKAAVNLGCRVFGADREAFKEALKIPFFKKGLLNVLSGIGMYGVTRPYKLPAPFLVVWNYTNACNLRCKHCYQRADRPTPDELSTEERLEIIDQLDENNVSMIAFSGGEPLMRGDFYDVAKYAYEKGFYLSIATNGTLLTRSTVARLKNSGIKYVEISLDGATKETHESFRNVEGCFEMTLKGIKNCVEAGMFTCIATTATKYNINEIPRIISLAKSIGVQRVIVFNFIPTGRGEEIVHLDLSPAEREDLLIYLYKELSSGKIEALCTAPQFSRVCLQQSSARGEDVLSPTHFISWSFYGKAKALAGFLGGCGAGRLYCAFQPNGLVTPCVFMPIAVGDLRRQTLKEIWLNSRILSDLRDRGRLRGRCGRCEYKYVCGGCRARAYAYHGDYLAPDPGCIREIEDPSIHLASANLDENLQ